ncbi:hypothetical protein NCU02575 [Neurospora crassa OR74A]|uniref:Uncharacterized protein n=1 Tax=Neurospora crassa (strain ATCC 24698 / 74-OR23-1A / CBS 708.71 / DSM 1257 / FGSC 987) TaxID=367110 RepID=Q1K954_NEUCR|nr:hypothetical protein NCU02575 [Neurospora crassa OR74A]EAA36470.1 hypothetical protein NCU02575 [Neurospora crassa OR74A]|eukprot:XP_965706.1 hypothetical protein NCU02575 [Neurospora crassa OR74A]
MVDTLTSIGCNPKGCYGYIPWRQERGEWSSNSSPPRDHSSLNLPPGVRLSIWTRPLSSLPHIPAITTSTLPPQVPPASVKSAVDISINIPSVGAREPATTGTKRDPPKVVIKHLDTLQQSTNFVIMLAMCHCHFFAPYDIKRADSVEELLPSVPIGSSGIRVPLRDQLNAIVTLACSAMS